MFTAPFAVFGPFLDYFRPSRSPYLLAVLAATVLICVLCATDKVGLEKSSFVFIPAYIILAMMVIFSLAFKGASRERAIKRMIDLSLSKVLHPVHDKDAIITISANIGESIGLVVVDEADSQFRFARTFGISASILTIYALLFVWSKDGDSSWTLWTTYAACIATLLIFSVFTLGNLNNIEPDKDSPLFQVAIVTVSMIVASAFIQEKIAKNTSVTTCDWEVTYSANGTEQTQTMPNSCNLPPSLGDQISIRTQGLSTEELKTLLDSIVEQKIELISLSKNSLPTNASEDEKAAQTEQIDEKKEQLDKLVAQLEDAQPRDSTTAITGFDEKPNLSANYYFISWLLFMALWLICAVYWLNRMRLEFKFDIGRRD